MRSVYDQCAALGSSYRTYNSIIFRVDARGGQRRDTGGYHLVGLKQTKSPVEACHQLNGLGLAGTGVPDKGRMKTRRVPRETGLLAEYPDLTAGKHLLHPGLKVLPALLKGDYGHIFRYILGLQIGGTPPRDGTDDLNQIMTDLHAIPLKDNLEIVSIRIR